VAPDRGEPALERLVPPEKDASVADDDPPLGAPAPAADPKIQALISPSSQPAATRPALPADPGRAGADFKIGFEARQRDDLLTARTRLNHAFRAGLPADQAKQARELLADLAERTIFSRAIITDDPLVDQYVVRSGDALVKIAKRFRISEDFLAKTNRITNKNFIREGRRLKVVNGPFHAAINKSDHLMHVYLQDVYVRTYRVALGANGSTPTGRWKVANHQENPGWTNPQTGKRWHANDPKNPIGEYWIGIEGIEGDAIGQFGYGIHGTIEPETIGQDVSMGCVRLAPDDIAAVYRLLLPGESLVTVSD